jgi:polysaccharide chain length determinant protein (PEP-CTERM system associated)
VLPGRQYTPEEILRLLWCRKWIVVAGVVLFTGAAVAASLQIPNEYKSETLILVVPQRVPDSYVHSTITLRIEDRLRSMREQILSRSRLEKVITDFDLYPDMRRTVPMEQVVQQMLPDIDVEPIRDDAFKVSFVSTSPRTAMIVADRLASMFIDEAARDREVMADGTNRFLESQLEDARTRLVEHEKKLEEFRRRNSGELPSQLESNLQVIRTAQQQVTSLNESIDHDRDRRLVLEKNVSDTLTGGLTSTADGGDGATGASRTLDLLERARGELKALELRLKPEHPDIAAKKRSIAELQRRVQEETSGTGQTATPVGAPQTATDVVRQARARSTQAEIVKLDKQIAQKETEIERLKQVSIEYQRRVDSLPGHESEMTALMRDYDTLQKIYSSLLAKKEDSKISANLEREQVGEQFKMLDPARLPERPYSPNRVRIALIGLAVGLLLGIGLAGFFEYRDTTLRTEDEILKMLMLPVVAAIPMLIAVADRRRQRRNLMILAAASILLIGGVISTAWRLHLWQGFR